MVLRPHILRYRGKAQKISKEKQKIIDETTARTAAAQKAVQGSKIVPKGVFYYGILGVLVFALPVIYFGFTMNSNDYTEDQLHDL